MNSPVAVQTGKLSRGFLLACLVAAAAQFLSDHYGAPAMLMALLIGIAFNFMATDARCAPGLEMTSRTVLRAGVALLGFRLSIADLSALGFRSFAVVIGLMALTIGFGIVMAPLLKRRWRFGLLTGGSVAICGASAALAISALLPKGKQLEQDTLFTVVAVTALSTLAMIFYPVLFGLLGLTDAQSGFLIGATIHDVAQVIGAGYSIDEAAGNIATIIKLQRVMMLPLVLLVVILVSGEGSAGSLRLPGFVIAFLGCFALNSTGLVSESLAALAATLSGWLLLIAISALGVRTSLAAVFNLGPRHLLLIVAETVFLLVMALGSVVSREWWKLEGGVISG
ncbi:putative sulfate exporter family transporter [Paracoccus sp. XHP0099]|uniref:Sulfate exporter family transporter n=2 Tax=Paracoccus marinaquae TaxID=2841926 RepID=A0ABS6APM6_9RHOB|nr:putative sulfate exporter family transporter [Paracoccus marinaquae]